MAAPYSVACGLPDPFQVGGLILWLRRLVQSTKYSQLAPDETALELGLLIGELPNAELEVLGLGRNTGASQIRWFDPLLIQAGAPE